MARLPIRTYAKGTWVLDQVETVDEVNRTAPAVRAALALPGVTGYSVRVKWNRLETAPGVYDFTIMDAARAAHPTSRLSVRFMAGMHTPTWHKGRTWTDDGGRTTYPCPFPTSDPTDGIYGNAAFEGGYSLLVRAYIDWCKANRVRLVHCSMYGHKWAEMANNDALIAWPGYTVAKMVEAHKTIVRSAMDLAAGKGLTLEFPGSGYNSGAVSPPVFAWVADTYPVDAVFHQSNGLGGPYNFGRASTRVTFGGQSFALSGPNGATASKNTLSWQDYYFAAKNSATSTHALYAENYLEAFTEPDLLAPMATWVPAPTP